MTLLFLATSPGGVQADRELKEFQSMHPAAFARSFQPVVVCGLKVELVPTRDQSHVHFDVLWLNRSQPNSRSFSRRHSGKTKLGMLSNRDVKKWAIDGSGDVYHSAAAHELGHVLGLRHSNADDPDCHHGDEDVCYGEFGTPQYNNFMGTGNEIDMTNAYPWLRAAHGHTKYLDWSATDRIPMERVMAVRPAVHH